MAGADHHLLFGMIALQVGLIDQAELVAAFQASAATRPVPCPTTCPSGAAWTPTAEPRSRRWRPCTSGSTATTSSKAWPRSRPVARHASSSRPCATLISPSHSPASRPTRPNDTPAGPRVTPVGNATSDGQRFQILRPHAKGGLGTVFVALDAELHREVALKRILDSHADDPASRHRFLMEAEITSGLEHPGIVPVYGLGTGSDGRPYYAMRFIRGESLKEAIDRFHKDEGLKKESGRRSLELRKLLRRFIDVCNAIDYAHSRRRVTPRPEAEQRRPRHAR